MRQIVELRECIGQPRDRRFRQTRACGNLLIAKQSFAWRERAENLKTAGERDDEFACIMSDRFIDTAATRFPTLVSSHHPATALEDGRV